MWQKMLQVGSGGSGGIDLLSTISNVMRKDVSSIASTFTDVGIPCAIDKMRVLIAYGSFVGGSGVTYTVNTCRTFDKDQKEKLNYDLGTSRDEIKIENGKLYYHQKETSLNKPINLILLYES